MQYQFQDSDIHSGDTIYVVGKGPGKVIDTGPKQFRISVAGRTRKVSYSGVQSGDTHQTVFWQNPILVQPAKEATLWRVQRELALNSTESVRKALINQELADYTDVSEVTPVAEVLELGTRATAAQGQRRLDEITRQIQEQNGVVPSAPAQTTSVARRRVGELV